MHILDNETSAMPEATQMRQLGLDVANVLPGASPDSTLPGQFNVIKRDGHLVPFDAEKIRIAIIKAFVNAESAHAVSSQHTNELSHKLTASVCDVFARRMPSGGSVGIEDIQDQVELTLMRGSHHKVARAYVLYREERRKLREQNGETTTNALSITHADGTSARLSEKQIHAMVKDACAPFEGVQAEPIIKEAYNNMYEGITEQEIHTALIIAARALVEQEVNYTYVTAQLLLQQLRSETCALLGLDPKTEVRALHVKAFPLCIAKGIEQGLLNPELAKRFNLQELADALMPERDMQFSYLGMQTLYDRYFLHTDETRIEWPQTFFMRVAMGLSLEEDNPTQRAIEFYQTLSAFDFMASTPTLFNSGTRFSQLSSCYLTTVPDDLHGIYSSIRDNAMLSKWSGGLGNDWSQVRALGAHIKGTNGKSQGVVPFLKVVNDTAVAVNQGGKRKGATCAYLESWHLDIEEFLELRKNTGDDRRRTHDMHTANWIPDLFMKRVLQNQPWTLFSPNETADLHDLYGKAFEKRYTEYESMAERGEIKVHKQVPALTLWRKMITMIFETGHPWLTFKDACNIRSPQQHCGVVHSSNLCTEITLNTSADEIAVCNLGSVNLVNHIDAKKNLDLAKLEKTVRTAIRMLDNVIDINYYAVDAAKQSNMKHRPIGLGLMGFQDALYEMGYSYNSEDAVRFADHSTEAMSYYAISASAQLAKERGTYESYKGSLWSQGVLPIDSIALLREERGTEYLEMDISTTMEWDAVRALVKEHGMRHSNVMAIAPTATISNIVGVNQSVEPAYANLYTKSNLSGEFTVINPHMVRELKKHNLWDAAMVHDIKCYEGSLSQIARIPEEIRARFMTAFEVEPRFVVSAASRRQKWIDQSQSLNIYIPHTDGERVSTLYQLAWQSGLKTTYYLRSKGATTSEMASITHNSLNSIDANAQRAEQSVATANGTGNHVAAKVSTPAPLCQLDDPDCEACQ